MLGNFFSRKLSIDSRNHKRVPSDRVFGNRELVLLLVLNLLSSDARFKEVYKKMTGDADYYSDCEHYPHFHRLTNCI